MICSSLYTPSAMVFCGIWDDAAELDAAAFADVLCMCLNFVLRLILLAALKASYIEF